MFQICPEPITIPVWEDQEAGGIVTFEGRVRNLNDGKMVTWLEYDVFDELAVAEGNRLIEEAKQRYDILDAACLHRVGKLDLGELVVWIGVKSRHR